MNDLPPLPSRTSVESRDPTSARRISIGLSPSPSVDVERESSRSNAASALRRAFSHARGSTVDENPLSPRRGENAGLETAGRMLSPILSRAREVAWENQRETESDALSMSDRAQSPRVNGHAHSSATESDAFPDPKSDKKLNPFKATAQAINALTHPVHMPKYKGGEGIRRLVETREKNSKLLGLSVEYWDISLFSFKGRAWPMLPQLLYIAYCTVLVVITCKFVPKYNTLAELTGLQFLISTMGTALFLLLSFRTNSSYERWWEGRKLWDGISSKVDDLTRIALAWAAAKDRACASGIIRWSLAYAFVAKRALRTDQRYPELAGILSQKEIDELESDIDPVTMVSDKLSAFVHQSAVGPAEVSPAIFSAMDADISGLNKDMTACMRILGTPMPFAYIVHLRSFIVLWLAGLPFAFVPQLGYWAILVCTVVGYELLGFETICVEIENPFGTDWNDLPLDTITTESFVKGASALAKLGHLVDVEPIVKADPLFSECRHAPMAYSRRGSEPLPEVIIPVRNKANIHYDDGE